MRLQKLTFFALLLSYFQVARAQNWETLNPSNTCTKRHESSLVANDNKIIILGGRGIKPIEIFDTKTQVWTQHAPTPIEIHHFQATNYKGEIYVMGAFTGTEF